MNFFIKRAICGNIGVGKSTLCQKLSNLYTEGDYVAEELENPYLEKFYDELKQNLKRPNKYALDLQKYFLETRYKKESIEDQKDGIIITDRCVLEYYKIFGKNLKDSGLMGSQDFLTYKKLYKQIAKQIRKPDVIIFLQSSLQTNLQRIQRRQRNCEKEIDQVYLQNLHEKYKLFLQHLQKRYKERLIIVETDNLNKQQVLDQVVSELQQVTSYFNADQFNSLN